MKKILFLGAFLIGAWYAKKHGKAAIDKINEYKEKKERDTNEKK